MFTRTLTAQPPAPPAGRRWLAAALLEAPDVDGQPGAFTAVEAVPVPTDEHGNPAGPPADSIETRHAVHDPGWYRLHWYSDGHTSAFSDPVKLQGPVASGRARRGR